MFGSDYKLKPSLTRAWQMDHFFSPLIRYLRLLSATDLWARKKVVIRLFDRAINYPNFIDGAKMFKKNFFVIFFFFFIWNFPRTRILIELHVIAIFSSRFFPRQTFFIILITFFFFFFNGDFFVRFQLKSWRVKIDEWRMEHEACNWFICIIL